MNLSQKIIDARIFGDIVAGMTVDGRAWGKQPCWKCEYVEAATRKREWRYWRCSFIGKPAPVQNVVEDPWLAEDPHPTCQSVNGYDQCRFFKQIKGIEDGRECDVPEQLPESK